MEHGVDPLEEPGGSLALPQVTPAALGGLLGQLICTGSLLVSAANMPNGMLETISCNFSNIDVKS